MINLDFILYIKAFINMQDLFAIATDQPFRFPSTFTFVLRAFSTLEGSFSLSLLHETDQFTFVWKLVN